MSGLPHIDYSVAAALARLVINRPERRNALSDQTLKELDAAFRRAVDDPAVRVIVLSGAGDHFCAGHDLKSAENEGSGYTVEQRYAHEAQYSFELSMKIWDTPKPVIASVQGACIAFGFVLACLCDLIVASEDAYFADPVVGSFASSGANLLVHPYVLGLRKAKDLLYTGRRMHAQEAHDCDLVSRIATRADLGRVTSELAQQIAAMPPFALQLVKRSLHRTEEIRGFRSSLLAHFDTHQISHVSEEFKQKTLDGLMAPIRKKTE